jgi:hypothetical protein
MNMNTNNKILSIGILLLVSGIIAAFTSAEPSRILQYLFILTSLAVGMLAIATSRNTKGNFVQSTYYSWIGFASISLSVSLGVWAINSVAFINVLGLFLLILGIIEFVFALQILNYETPIPWKIFGLKISISALTAIGAGWILTMAGMSLYTALLFLGVLLALAGLNFIQISRLTKV